MPPHNASTARAHSPFVDPCAVEAWDAWFRWRERGTLRDVTIEASWDRVAAALATAEPDAGRARLQATLGAAFSQWKLLPDPRLLRTAGTDMPRWPQQDLGAVLNVAAFVREPFSVRANFDRAGFSACAALAVRMLDNAIALAGPVNDPTGTVGCAPRLRIGMIGLADAMALLGLQYADAAGIAFAQDVAAVLAEATLASTVQLAQERGARLDVSAHYAGCAEARATTPALIADARRHGLRHAALTAIDSQPRLALLANNVADALEPIPAEIDWLQVDAPGGRRKLRSAGFAQTLRRRVLLANGDACASIDRGTHGGIGEQILLRATLSRWVDAPIDCVFRSAQLPDAADRARWNALADQHGLPALRWRTTGVVSGDDEFAMACP